MRISEVISLDDKKRFIDFPRKLYKDDRNWICPPDTVVEAIFDPARNHAFRNGNARRWILVDESGKTKGRIAAFIDKVRSGAQNQPTGGIGFFEVVENREAAFLLFDTARDWLAAEGMKAMDGPINFGENDNFWGLLVEGFMQQSYAMPYNKVYYKDYFEAYGFRNYFEQYSYHRTVRGEGNVIVNFPERIMKIAEWLSKRPGFTFRHFESKNPGKYINDICEIYNSTWTYLKEDFTPLDPAILANSFSQARPFMDEELIWFAYFNEKPVGFFVLLPDLNRILRHLNGKLHLWNKLRFLFYRSIHEMDRMRAVVGGVMHTHQNSGIESAIFYQLYHVFKRKPWLRELELSWVGDYNPKMLAIYEALGASRAKTHITYRYLIDNTLPFARYKDEATDKGTVSNNKDDLK